MVPNGSKKKKFANHSPQSKHDYSLTLPEMEGFFIFLNSRHNCATSLRKVKVTKFNPFEK